MDYRAASALGRVVPGNRTPVSATAFTRQIVTSTVPVRMFAISSGERERSSASGPSLLLLKYRSQAEPSGSNRTHAPWHRALRQTASSCNRRTMSLPTSAGTRSSFSNASAILEVSEASVSVRDPSSFVRHFGNTSSASPMFAYSRVAVRAKQALARMSSRNPNAATVRPSSFQKAGVLGVSATRPATRSCPLDRAASLHSVARVDSYDPDRWRHFDSGIVHAVDSNAVPGLKGTYHGGGCYAEGGPPLGRRNGNQEAAKRHSRPVGTWCCS